MCGPRRAQGRSDPLLGQGSHAQGPAGLAECRMLGNPLLGPANIELDILGSARAHFCQDGVVPKNATLGSFRKWPACGLEVCGKTYSSHLKMSEHRLSSLKKLVLDGHYVMPAKGCHFEVREREMFT